MKKILIYSSIVFGLLFAIIGVFKYLEIRDPEYYLYIILGLSLMFSGWITNTFEFILDMLDEIDSEKNEISSRDK